MGLLRRGLCACMAELIDSTVQVWLLAVPSELRNGVLRLLFSRRKLFVLCLAVPGACYAFDQPDLCVLWLETWEEHCDEEPPSQGMTSPDMCGNPWRSGQLHNLVQSAQSHRVDDRAGTTKSRGLRGCSRLWNSTGAARAVVCHAKACGVHAHLPAHTDAV